MCVHHLGPLSAQGHRALHQVRLGAAWSFSHLGKSWIHSLGLYRCLSPMVSSAMKDSRHTAGTGCGRALTAVMNGADSAWLLHAEREGALCCRASSVAREDEAHIPCDTEGLERHWKHARAEGWDPWHPSGALQPCCNAGALPELKREGSSSAFLQDFLPWQGCLRKCSVPEGALQHGQGLTLLCCLPSQRHGVKLGEFVCFPPACCPAGSPEGPSCALCSCAMCSRGKPALAERDGDGAGAKGSDGAQGLLQGRPPFSSCSSPSNSFLRIAWGLSPWGWGRFTLRQTAAINGDGC